MADEPLIGNYSTIAICLILCHDYTELLLYKSILIKMILPQYEACAATLRLLKFFVVIIAKAGMSKGAGIGIVTDTRGPCHRHKSTVIVIPNEGLPPMLLFV